MSTVPAWIVEILECPRCRVHVSPDGTCGACDLGAVGVHGVRDFLGEPSELGARYDGLAEVDGGTHRKQSGRFDPIDAPMIEFATGVTLEIGCGAGRLMDKLAGSVERQVGIDLSPWSLALAEQKGHTGLLADARALPFQDGVFDSIVSGFGVFAHLPLEPTLKEAHRVMKPGGVLVFHNFGARATEIAHFLREIRRGRFSRKRNEFHTHAMGSFRPVEKALAEVGLNLLRADCHLYVPGIRRIMGGLPLLHWKGWASWSWDVVVVVKKPEL